MAFQLVVKDDNNGTSDLREKLLGLFLKNGANPFDMKVRHIETMRSSGTKIAPVWHAAVERGKFQITKAILENASNPDIDQESTGFVSNERGYDEDYVQTALHITCTLKSHIDAFQILYCLLSSGANPNRFEIKLETRNRPDLSFEDDDGLDDPRSPGYQPSVESFRTITSPIHLALKNGNIPAVWLLTKFGADSSNPSIDCPRNQFPKKNFGRSSKDIELGSGSLEKYFDDFVKEKPDYAITTEKFLEMLEIENIDDMQLALTGELPGKYESFVTPDMNM